MVVANPYGSITSVVARVSVRRGPKLGVKWDYNAGNGLPIEFVPIPAGNFDMGSPTPEDGRGPDESVHQVTFKSSFWISNHEVTQSQYEALIGILPNQSVKGANIPIHNLTWKEAANYCTQLEARLTGTLPPGFEIRLPTEAEWEYAARGGVPAVYGFDMSKFKLEEYAVNRRFGDQAIIEVGQHKANDYGVYDAHGNVEEWCYDWYDRRLRSATDPVTFRAGHGRILRGGAWSDDVLDLRVAKRRHAPEDTRSPNRGFRIVAGLAIPK